MLHTCAAWFCFVRVCLFRNVGAIRHDVSRLTLWHCVCLSSRIWVHGLILESLRFVWLRIFCTANHSHGFDSHIYMCCLMLFISGWLGGGLSWLMLSYAWRLRKMILVACVCLYLKVVSLWHDVRRLTCWHGVCLSSSVWVCGLIFEAFVCVWLRVACVDHAWAEVASWCACSKFDACVLLRAACWMAVDCHASTVHSFMFLLNFLRGLVACVTSWRINVLLNENVARAWIVRCFVWYLL